MPKSYSVARILGFARLEPVLKLDNRWLAVMVSVILFGCLSLLGVVLSDRYESEMRRSIENQLVSIAKDAAQFVDGDKHREIRLQNGMENPLYEGENQKLLKLLHANENIRYVYTCFLDNGSVKFGLDPTAPGDHDRDGQDDKSYFGDSYADVTPGLQTALDTSKSVADDKPYKDSWGTFISGYAPVFAKDGSLEAVVGVDLSADKYAIEMAGPRQFRQVWILCSALIGLLGGVGALFVLNRVHRRFLAVLDAKRGVELANEELGLLNRQLDWQARTDVLTGLLNRQGFFSVVSESLDRLKSGQSSCCAMALMDLDNFKIANDHYGHVFGDEYLVAFAERLADSFDGALLGRIGGDEFVLMLEGENCGESLIESIRSFQEDLSANPIQVGLVSLNSSVSVGIVVAEGGDQCNDLMRRSDIAMYEAKRSGVSELKVYEAWMGAALESRVALERELRKGWEGGEFWMAVQPIIDMKSGRINAGEMLMRWTNLEGKFVSPMDFIPVAEDMGLIIEMGYWAIEEACRNIERLEREFPDERIHLSVNVSPRQLKEIDFVERLEEIMMKYSFHRGGLWLELTESSLMHDHKEVAAKMNRIQAMGILIALDDFGTGYSSLSMLLDIPLDCLKIDRSFVMKLGEAEHSEEVVRMILRLSELLDLYVVAEGIETTDHEELLRMMGCCWGQGYLYSRPVAMSDFVDQVADWKKAA